jgi:hypothetical protein
MTKHSDTIGDVHTHLFSVNNLCFTFSPSENGDRSLYVFSLWERWPKFLRVLSLRTATKVFTCAPSENGDRRLNVCSLWERWPKSLRAVPLRTVTEVFTRCPSENSDRSKICRRPPDSSSQTFTFSPPTKIFWRRALIRRDASFDIYVTTNRIITISLIGWLIAQDVFLMLSRSETISGLSKLMFIAFSAWIFLSCEHVQAMKQATGWRQDSRPKAQQEWNQTNLIQKI